MADFDDSFETVDSPSGTCFWERHELGELELTRDISRHVWTVTEEDDGSMVAQPGFRVVNFFGWIVSAQQWNEGQPELVFTRSTEEEQ